MPGPITVLWIAAVFLVILLIFYLSPFFISPIIKRFLNLWGFLLGRRKRKVLLSYAPVAENVQPNDLERLNENLKVEVDNEVAILDERVKQEENILKQEVDELRKRLKGLEDNSEKKKTELNETLLGKAF